MSATYLRFGKCIILHSKVAPFVVRNNGIVIRTMGTTLCNMVTISGVLFEIYN